VPGKALEEQPPATILPPSRLLCEAACSYELKCIHYPMNAAIADGSCLLGGQAIADARQVAELKGPAADAAQTIIDAAPQVRPSASPGCAGFRGGVLPLCVLVCLVM